MRTKENHVAYWKQTAADSWDSAEYLVKGKKYPEALFMYCLAIEKWLKAKWVFDNPGNYPPRIHDLHAIYGETELQLGADQIDFMDTINRWNFEGRYPDYKFTLKNIATLDYVNKQIAKLETLKQCLLNGL